MTTQPLIPHTLPADFIKKYEKLSCEQAGHLRHFHNLATQRDGEWGPMGGQEPGQEWLDAYRYQLATMAYAAGAAHYHRLPALRSVFKSLLESLIKKMLRREVWGYWFLTSHSGKFVDPDIEKLREPWADPIVKENIMYSGHLLLMLSLYTMLFNDDRYNIEGALTFNWNPIFWGMGPETFSYTRESLQKAILAEMERENWLGVCCEPNSIFIVCNQFPIIAMRYNDIRDGTNVAAEVIEKYNTAWEGKGMTQENGLFINWYAPKQDEKKTASDIGFTAWATAFMNAWNPTVAHRIFEEQAVGFLSQVEEERINVHPGPLAFAIRNLAKTGCDPNSSLTIKKAREMVEEAPAPPDSPFPRPLFGYILMWVSELGDEKTLQGILNHVDEFLQPEWERGGLYYPVNTQESNDDGNWTGVEPFTGNSAVGYARLNVFDGQRLMWTKPWTPENVSTAPYVSGVDLSSNVDFLRGVWDASRQAMVITLRSWDGLVKTARLEFHNLPKGKYGIYHNNRLSNAREVTQEEDVIELLLSISEEADIILQSFR